VSETRRVAQSTAPITGVRTGPSENKGRQKQDQQTHLAAFNGPRPTNAPIPEASRKVALAHIRCRVHAGKQAEIRMAADGLEVAALGQGQLSHGFKGREAYKH
jgi:hypothetical protein